MSQFRLTQDELSKTMLYPVFQYKKDQVLHAALNNSSMRMLFSASISNQRATDVMEAMGRLYNIQNNELRSLHGGERAVNLPPGFARGDDMFKNQASKFIKNAIIGDFMNKLSPFVKNYWDENVGIAVIRNPNLISPTEEDPATKLKYMQEQRRAFLSPRDINQAAFDSLAFGVEAVILPIAKNNPEFLPMVNFVRASIAFYSVGQNYLSNMPENVYESARVLAPSEGLRNDMLSLLRRFYGDTSADLEPVKALALS